MLSDANQSGAAVKTLLLTAILSPTKDLMEFWREPRGRSPKTEFHEILHKFRMTPWDTAQSKV